MVSILTIAQMLAGIWPWIVFVKDEGVGVILFNSASPESVTANVTNNLVIHFRLPAAQSTALLMSIPTLMPAANTPDTASAIPGGIMAAPPASTRGRSWLHLLFRANTTFI